jgi:hypothetical protein
MLRDIEHGSTTEGEQVPATWRPTHAYADPRYGAKPAVCCVRDGGGYP